MLIHMSINGNEAGHWQLLRVPCGQGSCEDRQRSPGFGAQCDWAIYSTYNGTSMDLCQQAIITSNIEAKTNHLQKPASKANVQKGVSLGWQKYGGMADSPRPRSLLLHRFGLSRARWEIAKELAGWVALKEAEDE